MLQIFLYIVLFIVIIKVIKPILFRFLENSTKKKYILQQITNMNGRDFEIFCGKLFELQGYKVKVTKATGDGGKDIIMWKGSNKYYVECKHFKNGAKVSRCIANKLYGAMCGDGIKKGIIITTADFSKECREWCAKTHIRTICLDDILDTVEKIGLNKVESAIKRL